MINVQYLFCSTVIVVVCVVWHEMKMVAVFGRERAVTREFGPSGEKGGVRMCP